MLSKKPQSSTAVTISLGRTVDSGAPKPAVFMIEDTTPYTMFTSASISSIP